MMKKFLNGLEDPRRPFFAPNYWCLRRTGLLLPKNKIGKAVYIFLHELVAFYVFTEYLELYLVKSDLSRVLTNLKISNLSIVNVVKWNTFMFWQDSWKEIIDYVTEADNYERATRDDVKGKIIDKYTKYCHKLSYFYWSLLFTTFVTVSHTPLLRYLSSSNYREDLRNGTELFPQILSSYMPFDKYHSPGGWITMAWHTMMCFYGMILMSAYDATVVVIMVFFGGKLELLRERCKQMLGTDGAGVSDEQAFKMIRQLHDVEVLLTKHAKLFNSLLSPVMFLYVVMCALMLCASAFQLTIAQNKTQTILMAEYLIFAIMQLFMYCWHSNDVLIKSQDVVYGPYESQWWAANVRQRKAVHILAGQFRKSLIFTAGPFTYLTLSTFITIMKGAYSYFTLLDNGK